MSLFFSEVARLVGAPRIGFATASAVAATPYGREQTIPGIVQPPRYRKVPSRAGSWQTQLRDRLTRQALIVAGIAAIVLVLATVLPAWAATQQGSPATADVEVLSSAGVTGSSATTVEDLGVASFVGDIPFMRQARYVNALAIGAPEPRRFVDGARQASVAEYIDSVGQQLALPYLSDAVTTNEAISILTWVSAVEQEKRAVAARQAALLGTDGGPVWRAPAIAGGTTIAGASITFYACVGNGFCGLMANGEQVFEGAAACSSDLPFGTRFTVSGDPTGRIFTCLDRGALTPTWVDVWFYDSADGWAWQSLVGTYGNITILD